MKQASLKVNRTLDRHSGSSRRVASGAPLVRSHSAVRGSTPPRKGAGSNPEGRPKPYHKSLVPAAQCVEAKGVLLADDQLGLVDTLFRARYRSYDTGHR